MKTKMGTQMDKNEQKCRLYSHGLLAAYLGYRGFCCFCKFCWLIAQIIGSKE